MTRDRLRPSSGRARRRSFAWSATGACVRLLWAWTSVASTADVAAGYASGFMHAADRFYICYLNQGIAKDGIVVAHGPDGRRVPANDLRTNAGTNDYPVGLAYFDGRFYVADGVEGKIFVYSGAGEYQAHRDFELRGTPWQHMTALADGTLLVGVGPDRVQAYDLAGARVPSRDLMITSGKFLDRLRSWPVLCRPRAWRRLDRRLRRIRPDAGGPRLQPWP